MNKLLILLFLIPAGMAFSQNMTGKELLKKSMAYHDPKGKWATFEGGLHLTETRPNGPDRKTHLHLDNASSFFELIQKKEGHELAYTFRNGNCSTQLDGSEDMADSDRDKYKLNCERAGFLRNYYLYLWGLPMKLTDPGTHIANEVTRTKFQGEVCLSMKVTYDESVGKDVWYFYFNPDNYALTGYRFYHDESKNDGEYITLQGETTIKGIRFPKTRKWFVNADDQFLGADILE